MTTDTGQAKEKGRQLTDEARSKGEQVGRQAKEEMGHVLDDARSRARDQAEDQTHRAAGALRGMADQLHSMAAASEEQGMMVDMAENGASRIRRLADHIDEGGMDGVVHDLETFARRRPGAFIAAGMGLGMLFGRVLRSSDISGVKEAVSEGGGAETQPESQEGESVRRSGELGGRSEPLSPEEIPEPARVRASGRSERPGRGGGI